MCAAGCDAQHEIYGKVRTASEFVERLGKERELRIEAATKMRAGGAADAQVIAAFEDGWLLTDAAWARCAGDAAALATKVKADMEGRVVELNLDNKVNGPASASPMARNKVTALPASVGKLQKLVKLSLRDAFPLTSLPAEIGGCVHLKSLNLQSCEGLTSLPPELSRCLELQQLNLKFCEGLTSLPDLSGLEKLKIVDVDGKCTLPKALQPWEDGGRKAFALPTRAAKA